MDSANLETCQYLPKSNVHKSYDLTMSIRTTQISALVYQKTRTGIFITGLFIIALNWEQTKYPLTAGWINKQWSIQTVESISFCCSQNNMPKSHSTSNERTIFPPEIGKNTLMLYINIFLKVQDENK